MHPATSWNLCGTSTSTRCERVWQGYDIGAIIGRRAERARARQLGGAIGSRTVPMARCQFEKRASRSFVYTVRLRCQRVVRCVGGASDRYAVRQRGPLCALSLDRGRAGQRQTRPAHPARAHLLRDGLFGGCRDAQPACDGFLARHTARIWPWLSTHRLATWNDGRYGETRTNIHPVWAPPPPSLMTSITS